MIQVESATGASEHKGLVIETIEPNELTKSTDQPSLLGVWSRHWLKPSRVKSLRRMEALEEAREDFKPLENEKPTEIDKETRVELVY